MEKAAKEDEMNRILIVEDEEAIANLIRLNLSRAGYYCEVVYDDRFFIYG